MFQVGLANVFKYQEKKRAGSLSPDHIDDLISGICLVSIQNVEDSITNMSSALSTMHESSSTSRSSKKKARQQRKRNKNIARQISLNSSTLIPNVKESTLPTITLGWTVNDAHEYKNNCSTIFGNIKPFLRDGGLSDEMKALLLSVIETTLRSIPDDTTCFNMEKTGMSEEFNN